MDISAGIVRQCSGGSI